LRMRNQSTYESGGRKRQTRCHPDAPLIQSDHPKTHEHERRTRSGSPYPVNAVANTRHGKSERKLAIAGRSTAAVPNTTAPMALPAPNLRTSYRFSPTSHLRVGLVYLQKRLPNKAIGAMPQAVMHSGGSTEALAGLAQAHAVAGDRSVTQITNLHDSLVPRQLRRCRSRP
jgi:hypothetical protein